MLYESSERTSRWTQQEQANVYQLLTFGLTGDKVARAMSGNTDKTMAAVTGRANAMRRWLYNKGGGNITKALKQQFNDAMNIPPESWTERYRGGWVEEPINERPSPLPESIQVTGQTVDLKDIIKTAKRAGVKRIECVVINLTF